MQKRDKLLYASLSYIVFACHWNKIFFSPNLITCYANRKNRGTQISNRLLDWYKYMRRKVRCKQLTFNTSRYFRPGLLKLNLQGSNRPVISPRNLSRLWTPLTRSWDYPKLGSPLTTPCGSCYIMWVSPFIDFNEWITLSMCRETGSLVLHTCNL